MLDRKIIRENPNLIKENFRNRNKDDKGKMSGKVDEFIENDLKWRNGKKKLDDLRAKKNKFGEQISELKKNGGDVNELINESSKNSRKIKEIEKEVGDLEKWLRDTELTFPNLIGKDIPIGKDENSNPELRKWGEPKKYSKDILSHIELGKKYGVIDFERGAKLAGHRFTVLRGWVSRLERALLQFMLDVQTSKGYEEILPPFLVKSEIMLGTGQLPKFADDLYKCEGEDLWLIPTAEVPLTNLYSGEVIEQKEFPLKLTAYTPCFRREAGAYGKDIKGYIRQHQFDKVELVKIVKPKESYKELELLTNDAEEILKLLEIPYRIIELCSGDLGFSAAKTYDLEVWIPSQDKYREVSSCSNCTDFQARRANIRYKDDEGKLKFVHTLNGSGVAIPRLIVSILENYQEKGKFIVPKVLRKYMGFDEVKLS